MFINDCLEIWDVFEGFYIDEVCFKYIVVCKGGGGKV